MKSLILSVALALSPGVAATAWAQDSAPAQTDAQTIEALHQQWATLIAGRDAAAIGALYAEDAVLMAPGEAAVTGADAIAERWSRQLALDGFAFRLIPEQLVISASGDLAHDRGSYDFAANLPHGRVEDTGKYVLIWQRVDGDWKVIADIFNSNPAE